MSTSKYLRVLREGLQVTCKTSVTGNTRYHREDIEFPHQDAAGQVRSKWENTKIVADQAEQEEADKIRDKARSLIRGMCAETESGLFCDAEREDELIERIEQIEAMVADFNGRAVYNRIKVCIFYSEVRSDNVRATELIFREMEEKLTNMLEGMAELDPKKIRDNAAELVNIEQIVTDDAQDVVNLAVQIARNTATEIKKAGDAVVLEIDRVSIEAVKMARSSFLDLAADAGIDVERPDMGGRALDLVV